MEQLRTERLMAMLELIKEEKDFLLKERIRKIGRACREGSLGKDLATILEGLSLGRPDGTVTISYLHTGYVTGSHSFVMAYYAGKPFVEENPDDINYDMTPYLAGMEEDWEMMWGSLAKKYKGIHPWEKEEVRRWYVRQVYHECGEVIRDILGGFQKGQGMPVCYGGYMDSLEAVGNVRAM